MPLTLKYGSYQAIPLVVDPEIESAGLGALDPSDSPVFAPAVAPSGAWGSAFDGLPEIRHDVRAGIGTMAWPAWGLTRFARGHFLCHAEQADRIRGLMVQAESDRLEGSSSGDDSSWGEAFTLSMRADSSDGGALKNGDEVTFPVYPLPVRPLVAMDPLPGRASSDGIYLLTLVDIRYFLRSRSVRQDIDLESGRGWSNLLNVLAEDLGITLTLDPKDVAEDYLVPGASLFALHGQEATRAIDAVATSIGRRIVANLDGTFTAQDAVAALEARAAADVYRSPNRLRKLGGGDLFSATL